MSHWVIALGILIASQLPDALPVEPLYIVSYIEVQPSSRAAALAAFQSYRAADQDGHVRFELFEQSGRPGHFALIETWRDQNAFDARDVLVHEQLLAALEPIRLSNYDERPYKTLTVESREALPDEDIVYVLTHVDVSPSPEVPVLLERLADESRREEGNLRFDVLQHTMRANHFTIIEAWRDETALDTHAARSHTRQYRDDLGPFLGSPLDERVYSRVD